MFYVADFPFHCADLVFYVADFPFHYADLVFYVTDFPFHCADLVFNEGLIFLLVLPMSVFGQVR